MLERLKHVKGRQGSIFLIKLLENLKSDFPREVWYGLLKYDFNLEPFKNYIRDMTWYFNVTDEPAFLTSDNPVLFSELGRPQGWLIFPISSNIVMMATNSKSITEDFYPASPQKIARINQLTVQNATQYIFHCEEGAWVTQLITLP